MGWRVGEVMLVAVTPVVAKALPENTPTAAMAATVNSAARRIRFNM